jgi:hypothetical protein
MMAALPPRFFRFSGSRLLGRIARIVCVGGESDMGFA